MIIVSHTTKNPQKRSHLLARVKKIASETEVRFIEEGDDVRETLRGAEVFLTYRFEREWWSGDESLKWVHLGTAGINHILFPELVNSKITVTNCRGMHGRTMAEYVLGVMLYFSQRLYLAEELKHHRDWLRAKDPMTRRSFLLRGKTVTIVGAGAVGSVIGEMCHLLGMRVSAINRTKRNGFFWAEKCGDMNDSDNFLGEADFVIICLPLTDKTRRLFDENMIRALKPQAILINISRGGIVDEDALMNALNEDKIGGACMDVFEREPLPEDSPLYRAKNLLITPHIAGNYPEYAIEVIDIFLDNLQRYVKGEPLKNVMDLKKGY
jgi:phosphoglycerate dehydrogenase-like enzyme